MKLELNQENFALLEKEMAATCVSIYLPLSKTTRERENDKVRFENLLKTAARQIIDGGNDKRFAREAVEPGFKLAQDHFFWKTNAAALAFFITAPQILRYFELPTAVKESVYAGKGFDLALLQKKLNNSRKFFLLAASKNSLALYRANDRELKELKIRGLPKNMKSLAPGNVFEKNLQTHGSAPRGKMDIMHGQGQGKETEKVLILKYFQIADKALHALLANKNDPLVFAGTDNLFTAFRQANTYPHLLAASLKGNFDNHEPSKLFEKAMALVRLES